MLNIIINNRNTPNRACPDSSEAKSRCQGLYNKRNHVNHVNHVKILKNRNTPNRACPDSSEAKATVRVYIIKEIMLIMLIMSKC